MKLYRYDRLIAESKTNRLDDFLVLREGVQEEDIPWFLFGAQGKRVDRVPMDLIIDTWLPTRVMSEDRIGIENELKMLGLIEYSVVGILSKTKGYSPTDGLWVEL